VRYDNNRVMDETRERGVVPIVCLRKGRPIPLDRIPYGTDEWKRLYRAAPPWSGSLAGSRTNTL
jgi:hypothetical protein